MGTTHIKVQEVYKHGKEILGKTMLLIALSTTLLGASLPAQAAEILPNELVMVQPREMAL